MSALSDYMNGFTTDNEFIDALYEEETKAKHEEVKYFEDCFMSDILEDRFDTEQEAVKIWNNKI